MIKKLTLSILFCFCTISFANASVTFLPDWWKKDSAFFEKPGFGFEPSAPKNLCFEQGYTYQTCEEGRIPDPTSQCPLEAGYYKKCICDPCMSYAYSFAEASADGYHPEGEPCLSCEIELYRREPNACKGFDYDTSNCGVSLCQDLAGSSCQSGEVTKYEKCVPCPVEEIKSCPSDTIVLETYWCEGALGCAWPAMFSPSICPLGEVDKTTTWCNGAMNCVTN